MKREEAGRILIIHPNMDKEEDLIQGKKILSLSLNKLPFDVMVTGEKDLEFRKTSKWIMSRLVDQKSGKLKEYDLVKFTNGYGSTRPRFYVEFKGFFHSLTFGQFEYSNGLTVEVEKGMTVIKLGKVLLKII